MTCKICNVEYGTFRTFNIFIPLNKDSEKFKQVEIEICKKCRNQMK